MAFSQKPPIAAGFAANLARLGRQLLLVPEAVLLLGLLCLHAASGAPPILALLGLGLISWFSIRMGLLFASRRAVANADYERAARLAGVAIWLNPWSADSYALLGAIHLARGQAEAAAEALRRAIAYYPFEAGLHTALSAALLEAGQAQEALAEARLAIGLNTACAPAYLHLAEASGQLGASLDDIEHHLRAGLEQPATPADAAALRCALAALLLGNGRSSAARLALRGAEDLLGRCPAPQRAGLHYQIGDLLRQTGDAEAARSHFSASAALDPHGRYAAAAWRAARS